ncbi:AraC family transcriptional regulator [Vibrio anguillarum]|uniref:AraC family transcriptional regulator n=1 Tax=Vibrio anguillarum TaxID=55601 RepID=UPI001C9CB669|nr:helix-turn-helix transcriptional regulator [Vibrio anguillarum]MBY7668590.1 helix-turn-helix transcriptional regulator [Vibrio anguillarum]
MATIHPQQEFNPDTIGAPVVGIASRLAIHDSGAHTHQTHQLLFAQAGCISIELDNRVCLIPPSRAAWIPSGMVHRVFMTGVAEYRSLYFSRDALLPGFDNLLIMEVNPLLRELIERMAHWEWDMPIDDQKNVVNLFLEEIEKAPREYWQLRMPKAPHLQSWLLALKREQLLPEPLHLFAKQIGMSTKTVSRLFKAETGMSYQAWRQQWRLLRAMDLLADNLQVSQVSDKLEFSSDSAFISFFKQHTGHTPLNFQVAKSIG